MENLNVVINFFSSPLFHLLVSVTKIFFVVLWLSLAYWTYRDAKSRGGMAGYWAIVVLLFFVFGWFIYLVVRPTELLEETKERHLEIKTKEAMLTQTGLICPACAKPIEPDFLICPYCLKKLRKACPTCRHALKLGWTICPYCQESL